MINVKTFISQCLLAIALAGSALGAIAGPTNFHFDIDTAGLPGTGLISLSFGANGDAGLITAKVTNVTGAVVDVAATGDAFVFPDYLTITNAPTVDGNYLDMVSTFGGTFGFDVAFSGDLMAGTSLDVSTFRVYVTDFDFKALAGDPDFGIASLNIVPGVGIAQVGPLADIVQVSAVPEPSALLLMMTGLGLVGFTIRRRKSPAA